LAVVVKTYLFILKNIYCVYRMPLPKHGGGARPDNNTLQQVAQQAYKAPPQSQIGEYKLVSHTPTINPPNKAPRELLNPPMMAAKKALVPSDAPISNFAR
jgi:hypothetical protein